MRAALLAVLAALLFVLPGLGQPGFFDYEGRYADVAHAMRASGDWVTPRLDGTLFLNKPPLLYWLTGVTFGITGETEWVRVVSVVAGAVTVAATCAIGARLWDAATGLAAGGMLATMLGFALEARKLRPDATLAALVAVAVWCWLAAETSAGARRRMLLAALWTAVGVGVLAKGLVVPALAGIPIGVDLLRRHGLRGVGRVAPGMGLAIVAAVVLPWHLAVSLRHPGFAWDYVVNQHLLFFLDRKFPRDSEGIPLLAFWGAAAARALPWTLLVPLARPPRLVVAWAAGTIGLFSLAPSRLEHYVIPALPALALCAADGWRRLRTGAAGWGWLVGIGLAIAAAGAGVLMWMPGVLRRVAWLAEAPGLLPVVRPAGALLAVGGVAIALAARRAAPHALLGALGAFALGLYAVLVHVERVLEPMTSWKPLAAQLAPRLGPDTTVVFEAPEEYQLVGGLAFYLQRPVALLEPPGFVPPTYLAGQLADVFQDRAAFEARWRSGAPTIFVSDLQRHRDDPAALVPPPVHVLGRSGWRWVLTNVAPAG